MQKTKNIQDINAEMLVLSCLDFFQTFCNLKRTYK